MALYLLRHAKAGRRGAWDGPDRLRPLTKAGRAQAQAFASWLANEPVRQVLSSPYTRCVQTVEPLAAKLGLEVEVTDALAEGSPYERALELLAVVPDSSVLVSHGDLIPDVIEALMRRGTVIDGQPDWRKGSTWVLERDESGVEPVITRAHAVPPGA